MAKTNISEIVGSLLNGIQGITKNETVVGAPQRAGETTVIPVHRVKIAFGAASASAGAHGARSSGDSGGHGAGGAVELEPVAAIAVSSDGHAHLLPVEGDAETAWSTILKDVPDLLARLAEKLGDRARGLIDSAPARAEEVAPKLSAETPPHLPKGES